MKAHKRTLQALKSKTRRGFNPFVLTGFIQDKPKDKPISIMKSVKTGRINQDLAMGNLECGKKNT